MEKPFISHIIVPVDFSEITERVLSYALHLADVNDSRLTLMHAVHVPPLAETSVWMDPVASPIVEQDLRLQLKHTAEQKLAELQERCRKYGIEASVRVREGVPHGEIIKCAEEENADLIVMGSMGHSALSRFLMGSNAEQVVRRSRLTVLCVKPLE